MKMLNLGFGNSVVADKVVAVVSSNTSPLKRLREEAKASQRLIDVTCGRRSKSIVITTTNHLFLSALGVETLIQRLEGHRGI